MLETPEVATAPEPETPDTPGESSADVQAILAEMGATPGKGEDSAVELFGQDGAEEPATPSKEPQEKLKEPGKETPSATAKRTSALQKLIDEKYKGDEEALVQALVSQQNAASDLRSELDELKGLLTSFKKEDPAVDPTTDDPDVQYWNEQKEVLDQEVQNLQKRKVWLTEEFDKASKVAARLEGKIEIADEFDKEKFSNELKAIQGYLENLSSQWQDIPRYEKKFNLDLKELTRRIETAKREALSKVHTQKAQEVQKAAERQAFRSELESLIATVAKENGIEADSRQFRTLKKHIWNDIYAEVSKLDPNGPGVDLTDAVTNAATEYFEAIGLQNKATFQTQSETKLAATSPRTPTPIVRPQGPSKMVPARQIDADQARRHAKAVLGG